MASPMDIIMGTQSALPRTNSDVMLGAQKVQEGQQRLDEGRMRNEASAMDLTLRKDLEPLLRKKNAIDAISTVASSAYDEKSYQKMLQTIQSVGMPIDDLPANYDANAIQKIRESILKPKETIDMQFKQAEAALKNQELALNRDKYNREVSKLGAESRALESLKSTLPPEVAQNLTGVADFDKIFLEQYAKNSGKVSSNLTPNTATGTTGVKVYDDALLRERAKKDAARRDVAEDVLSTTIPQLGRILAANDAVDKRKAYGFFGTSIPSTINRLTINTDAQQARNAYDQASSNIAPQLVKLSRLPGTGTYTEVDAENDAKTLSNPSQPPEKRREALTNLAGLIAQKFRDDPENLQKAISILENSYKRGSALLGNEEKSLPGLILESLGNSSPVDAILNQASPQMTPIPKKTFSIEDLDR